MKSTKKIFNPNINKKSYYGTNISLFETKSTRILRLRQAMRRRPISIHNKTYSKTILCLELVSHGIKLVEMLEETHLFPCQKCGRPNDYTIQNIGRESDTANL